MSKPDSETATRPTKHDLLQSARKFVSDLCGPARDLRQEYAAKNIATQLDRAWKEWEAMERTKARMSKVRV